MGLGLVAAFSIGSAIAMSTLGMVVVRAEDSVRQLEKWRVANALTFVSSILILCLGGFVFYHALTGLGLS
ncbi:ABC transporter permease [Effusibacillus lacus]|uniref:ABC transporter permease n=2 Tax=Effusibacillus lacus TaxID=1348429 RepID=A0A292YLC4_9BACL|nr:ABC transporter permease [Effusibacillus lacus]